jgi:hypothetical protein
MSALPPEADMLIVGINVCYVPLTDICLAIVELCNLRNRSPAAGRGERAPGLGSWFDQNASLSVFRSPMHWPSWVGSLAVDQKQQAPRCR